MKNFITRFFLYAEQGLSRQRVSIWIYEGQVHIEYQETLLAQYQANYDQHQKRLQDVNQPTLYQTPFASPQCEQICCLEGMNANHAG